MRKFLLTNLLVAVTATAFCQLPGPLLQLQQHLAKATPKAVSISRTQLNLYNKTKVNYLLPLYSFLTSEQEIKKHDGEQQFYSNLSQLLAFTGDYQTAFQYALKGLDTLNEATTNSVKQYLDSLNGLVQFDAGKYVLDKARDKKVLMLNEAHNNPAHRAFTYSLLEPLYKIGFRYLAMEAFSIAPDADLKSISSSTGWYIKEPVAGELARRALELGYTLINYEDSAGMHHTPSQRDSVQAQNLNTILKKDPSARILVHAGYGHISEEPFGDGYAPMALMFKKLSGVDPLTIDQTQMNEGSYYIYGKAFYDGFIKKYPVSAPSVFFKKNKLVNLLENTGYDITIVHPQTKYAHGRANWYDLSGARIAYGVKPTEKDLFFVQAFYTEEAKTNGIDNAVPADQTYLTGDDGYYYLFLRPGKYRIILRDMDYAELSMKEVEIK